VQINEMKNVEKALNQYYKTNTTEYNETKHRRSTKGEHRPRNVEESVQNRITDKFIKQQAPDVQHNKPSTRWGQHVLTTVNKLSNTSVRSPYYGK